MVVKKIAFSRDNKYKKNHDLLYHYLPLLNILHTIIKSFLILSIIFIFTLKYF